jgi:NADPH:quinone reductase-like Zn-dependent oxidoreductase
MAYDSSMDDSLIHATKRNTPTPGRGEVRVRVVAAGINRADLVPTSAIPGREFAGVIDELGPGTEGSFRVGDKVWGTCAPDRDGIGSFAEFVCASADAVGKVPAKLLFEEAAGIPLAGCAAHEALEAANPAEGRAILIHGAGGGVGHLAVQLARARGLKVWGTARFAKHSFLAGYGCEGVLDRSHPGWPEMLKGSVPEGFACILDTVGGLTELCEPLLAEDGAFVSFEPARGANRELDTTAATETLDLLAALVDRKKLLPKIEKIYPLSSAQEALVKQREGTVCGKLVLAR